MGQFFGNNFPRIQIGNHAIYQRGCYILSK